MFEKELLNFSFYNHKGRSAISSRMYKFCRQTCPTKTGGRGSPVSPRASLASNQPLGPVCILPPKKNESWTTEGKNIRSCDSLRRTEEHCGRCSSLNQKKQETDERRKAICSLVTGRTVFISVMSTVNACVKTHDPEI